MGVVYKARQTALKRLAALKMILSGAHADQADLDRFRTEAEAIARLQHPNIVQVFEVGEHQGLPYFSLEFCPGGSLEKKLAGTPLPPKEAAALVETLARAMQAAHEGGIIHRDLKPANVLLAEDGTPKITDFGLAKKLDTQGATSTGVIMGTPSYMAPEQAAGQGKAAGPPADIYALGAILYELLTGHPPFKAATPMDTLVQVMMDEPAPVRRLQPKVPRDLETICHKCLRKEPGKRYATAQALAEDLHRFREGKPILARPVGRLRRLLKWAWRRPAAAALIVVTVLSLAAIIAGGVLFTVQQRKARQETEAALQETKQAQQEAEAALRETKQILTYSHLALVNDAWRNGDTRAAIAELNSCPPETWGWEYHYLRRLCLASSFTLWGHRADVNSVCFSPDGGRLASASADGTARVWDPATGLETRKFRRTFPTCVCYSPDGRLIASAGEDGEVRLTEDAAGGNTTVLKRKDPIKAPAPRKDVSVLRNPFDLAPEDDAPAKPAAWCVAFSPDGKRLASGGEEKVVRLWDVSERKEIQALNDHTGAIRGVCFSPDGLFLASGDDDGVVRLWDARTGRPIRSLEGHDGRVNGVCFSPDGRRLASAGADRTVRLWDVATGKPHLTVRGHSAAVLCVCFSPDGLRLASGGGDQVVRLWDARTGQQLSSFRGHSFGVSSVSFRPDGQFLASGGWDGTVRLWDCRGADDGIALAGLAGKINHACFTPDRRKVVGGCADKTVRVWEAETGRLLHTLKGHAKEILRVCVSADGTRLASTDEREIKVWDAQTGKLEQSMDQIPEGAKRLGYSFTPDGQGIADIPTARWTAGGSIIKEVGWGVVSVYDIRSGKLVEEPRWIGRTESGPITAAAFAPDGRSLAVGQDDLVVVEGMEGWKPIDDNDPKKRPKPLAVLKSPYYTPLDLSYSGDGRRLAASYRGGEVVFWDVENKPDAVEGRTLNGHIGGVNGMDFSPDGRRLASAGADKTVRLWDTQLGRQALVLQGHHDSVLAVSFSADGERLTSVSRDGILRQWDGGVNLPVSSWTAPIGLVCTVCFSPDEQLLATATAEGYVQILEVPTLRPVANIRVGSYSTGVSMYDRDGGRTMARVKKIFFSPDGTRLATVWGNKLELWDVREPEKNF
jgi:WD40 repeat protein